MKKILIIILAFISLSLSGQTTYYVATTGNDVSGKGTLERPWLTIKHAADTVANAGDIIHVGAGTFAELNNSSSLALGVSLEGEGVTTIITSTLADYTPVIACMSVAPTALNGNQYIRNIKFNGVSLTAYLAIRVDYRSNVEIYNCTFEDFRDYAIIFRNSDHTQAAFSSDTYGINNSVHDNIITNCAKYDSGTGSASVDIMAQDNFSFYRNTITENQRAEGSNGFCFRSYWGHGLKFYENTFTKNNGEGGGVYNFFTEFWKIEGGFDVYGNTFNGSATLDLVNAVKGIYEYSIKIYNNKFLADKNVTAAELGLATYSIQLEERGTCEYIHIYNNYFKNMPQCIFLYAINAETASDTYFDHIYINNNVLSKIGVTDAGYKKAIMFINDNAAHTYSINFDYIYVVNNTIIGNNIEDGGYCGIYWSADCTAENIYMSNNIISDFSDHAIIFHKNSGSPTFNLLRVQNNDYFSNASDHVDYQAGVTITNLTESNSITTDPLFQNYSYGFKYDIDYDLKVTSPNISNGIDVGLTGDYFGHKLKHNPPDIGAIEYKSYRGYR